MLQQKQQQQLGKDNSTFEKVQFPSLRGEDSTSTTNYDSNILKSKIKEAYEKVIYWRRNLFEIPKGRHGKAFVQEVTTWINRWSDKGKFQEIAFDALSILPVLMLQRTSKKATGMQNKEALERRLNLWRSGNVLELVQEGEILQKRLEANINSNKNVEEDIAIKFRNLMIIGNVKGAMRLLEKNSEAGLLPINDDTMKLLREKHPEAQPLFSELLIKNDDERPINPVIFDEITPELIQKIAINMNGAAGPSQLNAEDWRRMIGSKLYSKEGMDLCRAISSLAKKLCTEKVTTHQSISALMASRLIPLNKDPGVRPILRRIIGKAITTVKKPDLQTSAGGL